MSDQSFYTRKTEKKPLVSFIITCFNEPHEMIRECLESILALTLSKSEREIIIVDDGSETSPLESLMDHETDFIYLRQTNRGLSQARNIGIELATGNYIQFVDGDDALIPNTYEQCLDLVRYKAADIVLFNETRIPKAQTQHQYEGPLTGTEYMRHNNLRATACGYIFRRSLLLNLRFTKELLHEDEEFTPQLVIRAENLYITPAQAYFYRERSQSITHKTDKRWKVKRLADTEKIIIRLQEKADLMPSKERTAMQRRVAQLTMDYIYNIITMTHDEQYLNHALRRLEKRGLFPLPDKKYTQKYKYFRFLTNNKLGRKLLLAALPKAK